MPFLSDEVNRNLLRVSELKQVNVQCCEIQIQGRNAHGMTHGMIVHGMIDGMRHEWK